jgi:hypothetical protein
VLFCSLCFLVTIFARVLSHLGHMLGFIYFHLKWFGNRQSVLSVLEVTFEFMSYLRESLSQFSKFENSPHSLPGWLVCYTVMCGCISHRKKNFSLSSEIISEQLQTCSIGVNAYCMTFLLFEWHFHEGMWGIFWALAYLRPFCYFHIWIRSWLA